MRHQIEVSIIVKVRVCCVKVQSTVEGDICLTKQNFWKPHWALIKSNRDMAEYTEKPLIKWCYWERCGATSGGCPCGDKSFIKCNVKPACGNVDCYMRPYLRGGECGMSNLCVRVCV